MEIARKEKWLSLAGLGMALAGGVWFGLAAAGILLQGLARAFGFPFGGSLVVGGLVMAGIYFARWRRIKKLTGGENLLAQWRDGERAVYLAPDCAYVDGDLILWSGTVARLEHAALVEKGSYGISDSHLEIDYAVMVQVRHGMFGSWKQVWEARKLSLRIPPDKMPAIGRVVEVLQEKIGKAIPEGDDKEK